MPQSQEILKMTPQERANFLFSAFRTLRDPESDFVSTENVFKFLDDLGAKLPRGQVLEIVRKMKRRDLNQLNAQEFDQLVMKAVSTKPKYSIEFVLNIYVMVLLLLEFALTIVFVQKGSVILKYAVIALGTILAISIFYVVLLPLFFRRTKNQVVDISQRLGGPILDPEDRAVIFVDRRPKKIEPPASEEPSPVSPPPESPPPVTASKRYRKVAIVDHEN